MDEEYDDLQKLTSNKWTTMTCFGKKVQQGQFLFQYCGKFKYI